MLKPSVTPHQLIHQEKALDSNLLGVMSWNTQKSTMSTKFQLCLTDLLARYPTQLLLLQEAKLALSNKLQLGGWSYAVSPNIQTPSHLFGVLTAGECAFSKINTVLSQGRELSFATHKSQIMTEHPLSTGDVLLVVNIHAVNFVSHGQFQQEIMILRQILLQHQGPLIVAGDFNIWSRSRRLYLVQFCRAMGLKKTTMADAHHIKRFGRQPLDFILYRDLKLRMATAINTPAVSDHNPIYAQFYL
ncbi:endonuclease/exonuclease/phosphatase family protein [Rheinheimera sp. MMS21-TC3]|uniref:endonuclease/exonuclease/phosphatase family protein n=1 Tax=Rheinheimera sp. MMS21-TC3 TaxID=3072790 RepID=UPI0028C42B74|nr:endonuclease/exonuclease/phosphatase family protein [Rheinheimera sp. MMS21-TC3]WNO61997.1 endonuclease/exonuclease/phosphatase family protein [Rheinheimera sp. MMS21-TC3]